ncbi:TonB-dependent receptor [Microbulbifer sp. 2304DJ12-6]|uniref:TonB-dependent receptor n=1 Tax=Microbulbifer sp. 2304DJ12-6 TaxID=3233340 RepID=UPI0039AFB5EB
MPRGVARPIWQGTSLNCMIGLLGWLMLPGSGVAEQERIETLLVTASRAGTPTGAAPERFSEIGDEALALVGHSHIQQSLVRVPGVNLARGNGQEYLPALRSPVLSGAGACGSVLSAEDGIPLRAKGFCNINELFESHSETARSIEVIRGPAGILFGANALHGVVNVISPTVGEQAGGTSAAVGFEAGPEAFYRAKLSADTGTENPWGLRMDLSLSTDGGYRDRSGYDQQKLSLQYLVQAGPLEIRTRLAATNVNQETAGYIEGTGAYRSRRASRENPNPEAFRDAGALRLYSRLDIDLDGDRALVLTPYLRKTEMRFLQHYLPGQALEENGQESAGIRSRYRVARGDQLELVAGVDGEFTRGYLRETQAHSTEGSDFLQATIPTGKHYDYEVDAWSIAPFALATWRPTERWHFLGGLRFEAVNYHYDNNMLTGRTREDGTPCGFGGCRFSRPQDREDRFMNGSPKLGAVFRAAPGLQLFANLAQGYRVPQTTELYRLQREQRVAALDSERIKSIELGLRGRGSGLLYELVAYGMRKRNVIFRDTEYFNRANGKTAHRGLELAFEYAFVSRWRIETAASYAEHRYRDTRRLQGVALDGRLVDSAPRVFGSARLRWQPLAGMAAELEWLHQGRYYTDPQNRHEYPGHNLLNLRLRWAMERWALSVRALNLANKAYAERADYSRFGGERYLPGARRVLYLSVSADW